MRTLVTCALVSLLGGAAWAAPVTLNARALLQTPGVVAVDADNTTTVQFCDEVNLLAYKAAWLHAEVVPEDKRVLLLDATAKSGETALSVWVKGQGGPLQLIVRASNVDLANHIYYVACEPPAAQAPAPRPAGATPAAAAEPPARPGPAHPGSAAPASAQEGGDGSWDAFIGGLSPRQWELFQALVAAPTTDHYAAFTASLSPDQAAAWERLAPSQHLTPSGSNGAAAPPASVSVTADRGPATEPAPSWLAFQAEAKSAQDGVLIPYTVTNTGAHTVVLDAVRLRIVDATGTPVPDVRVTREDTSAFDGRIGPGGAESGTILVRGTPRGPLTIRWPAVAVDSSGTTYVLSQTLQVP